METRSGPKNIDDYIKDFPGPVQKKLREMRIVIRKAVPGAEEKISYRMPAFFFHGILVYFAAYRNHIGFYPASSGIEAFRDELSAYKFSRGAVRFPLDKPLPLKLISQIVIFRREENLLKAEAKSVNRLRRKKG